MPLPVRIFIAATVLFELMFMIGLGATIIDEKRPLDGGDVFCGVSFSAFITIGIALLYVY